MGLKRPFLACAFVVLRGWLAHVEDGTLKLYLTTRLLRLRRDDGPALAAGAYRPMAAEGEHAERLSHSGAAMARGTDRSGPAFDERARRRRSDRRAMGRY